MTKLVCRNCNNLNFGRKNAMEIILANRSNDDSYRKIITSKAALMLNTEIAVYVFGVFQNKCHAKKRVGHFRPA